jgi:thymidylate synthase ThyX
MPIHWGKNQPGMQAHEELSPGAIESAKGIWTAARNGAIACAEAMIQIGAHKQIANRILEPFSHITVLVTSDCWNNFFALRDHPDAQPEIRVLAQMMKEAMDTNVPRTLLDPDEWHLPYIDEQDVEDVSKMLRERKITRAMPTRREVAEQLCAISAARCARVSYLTHDKKRPTIEDDMALFYRLTAANPPHMSPCEHQAHPSSSSVNVSEGNFRRWHQFRHTIHDNTVYDC